MCPSSLSLRAQFAVENEPINQLHGSESQEEAERELNFFFPKQQTLAVIKPDAMEEHKGSFCSFRTGVSNMRPRDLDAARQRVQSGPLDDFEDVNGVHFSCLSTRVALS